MTDTPIVVTIARREGYARAFCRHESGIPCAECRDKAKRVYPHQILREEVFSQIRYHVVDAQLEWYDGEMGWKASGVIISSLDDAKRLVALYENPTADIEEVLLS